MPKSKKDPGYRSGEELLAKITPPATMSQIIGMLEAHERSDRDVQGQTLEASRCLIEAMKSLTSALLRKEIRSEIADSDVMAAHEWVEQTHSDLQEIWPGIPRKEARSPIVSKKHRLHPTDAAAYQDLGCAMRLVIDATDQIIVAFQWTDIANPRMGLDMDKVGRTLLKAACLLGSWSDAYVPIWNDGDDAEPAAP